MAMITTEKSLDRTGNEHCVFECLRCGYVETTIDQLEREATRSVA